MDFETFCRRMHEARRGLDGGLVIFHQVPSSHGPARRVAREYLAEGVAVPAVDLLAWHQTAGQGRQGRKWSSPAGAGIYASMIRRLDPKVVRTLPMTVPTALALALRERGGVACELKWPNDLMVGGLKLGGVLLDVISGGDSEPVSIISFGINHAGVAAFDQPAATSTTDLGSTLTLDELALCCLVAVDAALSDSSGGLEPAVVAYRDLSAHLAGDVLECHLDGDSTTKVRGIFRGIDDNGLLRLEVAGEVRTLSVGRLVSS